LRARKNILSHPWRAQFSHRADGFKPSAGGRPKLPGGADLVFRTKKAQDDYQVHPSHIEFVEKRSSRTAPAAWFTISNEGHCGHVTERVIGQGGTIPWHLPEDFKWFKKTTMGHVLVMDEKPLNRLASRSRKRNNRFKSQPFFFPRRPHRKRFART